MILVLKLKNYPGNPYVILFIAFVGLLIIWYVFSSRSLRQEVREMEATVVNLYNSTNSGHAIPAGKKVENKKKSSDKVRKDQSETMYVQPDAITSATPRTITWMNNVIDRVKPGVVGIFVGSGASSSPWKQNWQGGNPAANMSVGSGVLISPRGYVVTNNHVVQVLGHITVSVFTEGGYTDYPATVIESAANADLALLKINGAGDFPASVMGDSDMVEVGDRVIAIGNPYGLTQTVTSGIISAKRNSLQVGGQTLYNLLQTDAPINPGNSGGALCNMRSEVIGINFAIYSPVESVYTGISFAIPINQVKDLFKGYINIAQDATYQYDPATSNNNFRVLAAGAPPVLQEGPQVPKTEVKKIQPAPGEGIEEIAWLGIDLNPVNEGVVADEIEGLSPMEAGLEAGDIIRSVNGIPTPDIYAFKEAIKQVPLRVGQSVMLDVYRPRNGKTLFIGFKLKTWDLKGR